MSDSELPPHLLALLSDAEREALASGELDSVLDPESVTPILLSGAQEALRQREQEFRALVENAPDVIVRIGSDGLFSYANPAFRKLLAVPAEAISGRSWSELPVPSAFAAAIGGACSRVVESASESRVELEWHNGPDVRTFSGRIVPELSEDGEVLSVLAVLRDESESRRAQRELQRSRDLLDGTLDGLSAHIAILDGEGTIMAVNEAWRRFARENGLEDPRFGVGINYISVAEASGLMDAEGLEAARAIRQVAAGERSHFSLEYPCHGPVEQRWFVAKITTFGGGGSARVIVAHENITERRLAEEARKESEQRYQRLFENSLDGVLLTAPDGTIFSANPAACSMLGYTEDEIKALGRSGLIDDSDPRLPAALERRQRTGSYHGELTFLRKDGTPVPVELTTSVYTDHQGQQRSSTVLRDVSERKLVENRLREAEAHYRRLVTSAAQCIYVLDAEGRFTELNPAGEVLLGRRSEEVLGHPFAEVIAPFHLDHAADAFAEVVTGMADNLIIETAIRRPDDSLRLVSISVTAIRQAGGITGVHGIAQDVTDDRAREAQRRLLATALDRLQEGIFVLTLTGQYLYVNQAFRRIFEIGPGRQDPKHFGDLTPNPRVKQQLREVLSAAAQQGRWAGRLQRGGLELGSESPLDIVLSRVDQEGDEAAILFGIVQDATQQVEREQQLRRIERLASVGTLIGGVAHELNNPLHAITNFADLMLQEERNADDLEALEIMRREADRAAKVVADLRLIARQTQDSVGMREAVDLNDIVTHVLRVRRYALKTSNVEIRQELASNLPPVLADRGEMEQVVMNLVVNAEQAMEAQPAKRLLTLRTRLTPTGAAVHVVDTGSGIPPELLSRIFDPFYTTKPPGVGTGLGLSLVHSIVTEHGGTIQVDSEPGKGTSFRVDLPVAPVEEEQAAQAHRVASRPLRVLVADDEESIRQVTKLYLEHLGHAVETAADGATALRCLEEGEYDVIVSDLRMPGMGGDEFLKRLRAQGSGLDHRLIFITGDVASSTGMKTHLGVPLLGKPMQMQELAEALEIVAQGRAESAGVGGVRHDR